MGTRVKKVLGYGITDLATDGGGTIIDPRVDWEQFEANWEQYEGLHLADMVQWLRLPSIRKRMLQWMQEENLIIRPKDAGWDYNLMVSLLERKLQEEKTDTMACVHWRAEFGMPGVMVLRCPDHPKWYRVDDIIDHYEEQDIRGPKEHVRHLDVCGIYPCNHGFVRFREAKPEVQEQLRGLEGTPIAKHIHKGFLQGRNYNMLVGKWDPDDEPWTTGVMLEHLLNDWRPGLPFSLIAMMEFLGCFPGRGLRDSLRPMVYTYWS